MRISTPFVKNIRIPNSPPDRNSLHIKEFRLFYTLYEKSQNHRFSNKILTKGISYSSYTTFLKLMEIPIVLPRYFFSS